MEHWVAWHGMAGPGSGPTTWRPILVRCLSALTDPISLSISSYPFPAAAAHSYLAIPIPPFSFTE